MSEFRIHKHRVSADLTLVAGVRVSGFFFVAESTPTRTGPERVGDLLNGQSGFFPFERFDGSTALYNRAHLVVAALARGVSEAEMDPGFVYATKRLVAMTLSTGANVSGTVPVYRPIGRDRLSDYARDPEHFRYLLTDDRTLIVNSDHIVQLIELPD